MNESPLKRIKVLHDGYRNMFKKALNWIKYVIPITNDFINDF